ncbi:MAG: hypothetical protein RRB13_12900 [bacterium]|nr:hypothetical protein [bacterium]
MLAFKRILFVALLLVVSLTASAFMVLEAGQFYQSLYQSALFPFMGYLAATLNEAFMAVMAAVWIPGKSRSKGHPINYLFRGLLALLFLTTVGGASFNAIDGHLKALEAQASNAEVIEVLRGQIEDHEKSLQTFVAQHQPINSALTVRRQAETKAQLMEALAQQKATTGLWAEVLFLVVLRVAVQMANLSCIWLAGWTWRRKEFSPAPSPAQAQSTAPAPVALQPGRALSQMRHTLYDALMEGPPQSPASVATNQQGDGSAQGDVIQAPQTKPDAISPQPVQTALNPVAIQNADRPQTEEVKEPMAQTEASSVLSAQRTAPVAPTANQPNRQEHSLETPNSSEPTLEGARVKTQMIETAPAAAQPAKVAAKPLQVKVAAPQATQAVEIARAAEEAPANTATHFKGIEAAPAKPAQEVLTKAQAKKEVTERTPVEAEQKTTVLATDQKEPAGEAQVGAVQEAPVPAASHREAVEVAEGSKTKTRPAVSATKKAAAEVNDGQAEGNLPAVSTTKNERVEAAQPCAAQTPAAAQSQPAAPVAPKQPKETAPVATEAEPAAPSPPVAVKRAKTLAFPTQRVQAATTAEPVEEGRDDQALTETRNRITELVERRNAGVPLGAFAAAIGERQQDLRDIANFRLDLPPALEDRLEAILGKLERLYNDELALSV